MQKAKKKDVLIPVLIITVLLWLAVAVFFIISSGRADAEREAREKLIANADSALETLYQTKQAEVNAANAASDAAYQDQLSAYVAQLRSGYQQAVVDNNKELQAYYLGELAKNGASVDGTSGVSTRPGRPRKRKAGTWWTCPPTRSISPSA